MFQPPFCPYPSCAFHHTPAPRFCSLRGTYWPRCRPHPVQRFRCRACRRSFSRQTFRADYRHKKPHLNAPFLRLMVACVGGRQAARVGRLMLGLAPGSAPPVESSGLGADIGMSLGQARPFRQQSLAAVR